MKVVFFSAILILNFFQAHSQNPRIGLSIKPLVSGVSNTNNWSVSNKYRVGWQVSGEYTNSISKNIDFSLGTGFSFWQVGFKEYGTWPSMLSSTGYEKIQMKEVTAPFDVYFNLKRNHFFVTTGVTPTFVLSALNRYNYFEPENEVPWRSVKLDRAEYAAFNVGVKLGVGAKIFMTPKMSLVISPEIQTNLFRDSPKSLLWFTSEKIRRWNLGVKLGVQYKLKRRKTFRTLG